MRMKELDKLHYSFREIDGYNKPFNFVLSPRELGKTTSMWMQKIYPKWKVNKRPWIYLVRKSVEITDALITSIQDTQINKFSDDNIELQFSKGSFKDGIVDVCIKKELFIRIVSLSIDLRRIKLAVLKNVAGVFMDEYIIDPRTGEKYGQNEAFKIKEAYSTWRRECDGMLKVYFVANPYSLYNPLFVEWDVNVGNLRKDSFYTGDTFVIHWAILGKELREKLLEQNPLYKFDEEYNQYAVEGCAVNDKNIRIGTLPPAYNLRFVFKIDGKTIGIFQNNFIDDGEDMYFVRFVDNISQKRTIYCFDFSEMISRSCLMSSDESLKLAHFKYAMRRRCVVFEDVACYYLTEEIYKNL